MEQEINDLKKHKEKTDLTAGTTSQEQEVFKGFTIQYKKDIHIVQPNDPCHCGVPDEKTGKVKKYKKCCMWKD